MPNINQDIRKWFACFNVNDTYVQQLTIMCMTCQFDVRTHFTQTNILKVARPVVPLCFVAEDDPRRDNKGPELLQEQGRRCCFGCEYQI